MLDIHKTITLHSKEATQKTMVDATILFTASEDGEDMVQLDERERYSFVKELGKGGMGDVQRVFDAKLKRYVAKKTLHHKHLNNVLLKQLFQNEAQITGALQHSGICSSI